MNDAERVERGVLEVGTVKRDVVRNAVDDDGVGRRLVKVDGAGLDEFSLKA